MSRLKKFAKNAAMLIAVALIMRTVGVIFNAYAANKIGAEGMGLYSLVMSVYVFAVTVATSGINLAVTRLVAEELALGRDAGAIKAMSKCVIYALSFGCFSACALFVSAPLLAEKAIGDERMTLSLRALSAGLPFIALSNVFSGYFYAVKRVFKSASSNIIEQFVKIAVTCTLLWIFAPRGVEYACMALVVGTSVSEGLSFSYLLLFYLADKKKYLNSKTPYPPPSEISRRMFAIALPVALSAYLRSGLVTIEHMLIPRGLRKFGQDYSLSLAAYGTVSGMALPVLLFPAAVSSTFAGLIIPEMSELAAKYKTKKGVAEINYIVKRSIGAVLIFGIGTAGIFLAFSSPLGDMIYSSADASYYIAVLAPLVPVMYLDTCVDGMLKGLGEQLYSMRVNILDASLSILLVYLLLPKMGIMGYIVCIFATELINAALSLWRLIKITGAKINVLRRVIMPIICMAGAYSVTAIILRPTALPQTVYLIVGILFTIALYAFFLGATGTLGREEYMWMKKIFTKQKAPTY
ncbi:MAG: oligosaccharide flippase family protein [Clostridia bacterium]|nr:oligosaccharide flippase family protein [Clostridia bacterium]